MSAESRTTHSSPTLLIFAIGLVFLATNIWSFRHAYLLKHAGVAAEAVVTKTYMIKRRASLTFNADYALTVSGKTYDGSADVTRDTFMKLRPGGPITVRYVPSEPSLNESSDISHSGTTLFLTEFFGFPVSLFILFIGFRGQKPVRWDRSADSSEEEVLDLPNTVKGVAYMVYPVLDMKRARQFYEGELGLRATVDLRGEWIEYHLWDTCFALTSMLKEAVKPSASAGGSIALEVQNVDDFVIQLKKKGTPVKVEPFSTRVCRMAVVLDPEGNALTLHHRNGGS